MKKKINKDKRKVVYYLNPIYYFQSWGEESRGLDSGVWEPIKAYLVAEIPPSDGRLENRVIVEKMNGHQIIVPDYSVVYVKDYKKEVEYINRESTRKFIERLVSAMGKIEKISSLFK